MITFSLPLHLILFPFPLCRLLLCISISVRSHKRNEIGSCEGLWVGICQNLESLRCPTIPYRGNRVITTLKKFVASGISEILPNEVIKCNANTHAKFMQNKQEYITYKSVLGDLMSSIIVRKRGHASPATSYVVFNPPFNTDQS